MANFVERNIDFYQRLRKLLKRQGVHQRIFADRPASRLESRIVGAFAKVASNAYMHSLAGSTERLARTRDYEMMDLCVIGSTKIATPDGLETIKELSEKYSKDEKFIVYSYDHEKQQILPALAHHARKTKTDSVWKVIFDDDSFLIATKEHPIMTSEGHYKQIQKLVQNDLCMSFFSEQSHKVKSIEYYGIEEVYDLTVDKYHNFATDTVIVHNSNSICHTAANIISDDATTYGENGRILDITSGNHKIITELNDLFFDRLNLDFNLWNWIRNLIKYGDFFLLIDVQQEQGITSFMPLPTVEIEREEAYDGDINSVRFKWNTASSVVFENWQISHFRMTGDDTFLPYGKSIFEAGRRIWKQLNLIEDAMLVYRIQRAPERRIFKIDVGNLPPNDIPAFMEKAKDILKRSPMVDSTGVVDLRYSVHSAEQDYFLGVRGKESGTDISTLPGASNLNDIEDVLYVRCLRGNTIIKLLNGFNLTIKEIVETNNYENLWTMSINPQTLELDPVRIITGKKTRLNAELVRVHLDNGKYVDCTPDHKFMMRDGVYTEAQNLKENDSLMPLYTKISDNKNYLIGYEMIYNPGLNRWNYVHQIVGKSKYPILNPKQNIIHHCSFNKLDNSWNNLLYIENNKIHTKIHATFNKIRGSFKGKKNGMYRHDITIEKITNAAKECKLWEELIQKIGITSTAILNRIIESGYKSKADFIQKEMPNFNGRRLRKSGFENYNIKIEDVENIVLKNNYTKISYVVGYFNIVGSLIKKLVKSKYNSFIDLRLNVLEITIDKIIDLVKYRFNRQEICEITGLIPHEINYLLQKYNYENLDNLKLKNNIPLTGGWNKGLIIETDQRIKSGWCKGLTKKTDKRLENIAKKISIFAQQRKREKNSAFVNDINIKKLAINYSIGLDLTMQELGNSVGHSKTLVKRILNDNNITWNDFKKEYKIFYEYNHKVINVEVLKEKEDTYDIQVSRNSNFSLESGVFVHNSSLIASLGIPKAYLTFDEGLLGKTSLSQEDLRFARMIQRVQKLAISELNKLAMIHLYAKGYDIEDLMDFKIHLTNPSTVNEQMKLEVIQQRLTSYQTAVQGVGVDREWAQRHILKLSDHEIQKINLGVKRDSKFNAEVQQVAVDIQQANQPAQGQPGQNGQDKQQEPLAVGQAPIDSIPGGTATPAMPPSKTQSAFDNSPDRPMSLTNPSKKDVKLEEDDPEIEEERPETLGDLFDPKDKENREIVTIAKRYDFLNKSLQERNKVNKEVQKLFSNLDKNFNKEKYS